MGKAADWLREERRNVLGHWSAVCLRCGAARRWFEEFEAELPDACPACGGELLHRCPTCNAPFSLDVRGRLRGLRRASCASRSSSGRGSAGRRARPEQRLVSDGRCRNGHVSETGRVPTCA